MSKGSSVVKAVFRGIARASKTYTLEIGPLRASGMPALLLGVTGIVLASGITALLARQGERLPETLREARGLAESLRTTRPRLQP
ncbi:MAG: hypothetical protein ACYDGM_02525 [Vulcanimicrobiaceae bacterium]